MTDKDKTEASLAATEPKVLNPELVLWCAKKAVNPLIGYEPQFPGGCEWKIASEYGVVRTYHNGYKAGRPFNPLTSADDREALMLCLMRFDEGTLSSWSFHRTSGEWVAYQFHMGEHRGVYDESWPLLLLKAASAQSGIELYAGDK